MLAIIGNIAFEKMFLGSPGRLNLVFLSFFNQQS